ncbi:MAG: hypothetical protein WKG00_31785 [Polyangiaceae bacterium]
MARTVKSKRRILTAGAGLAAFTAVEGLACGNPVEPRYHPTPEDVTPTATVAAPDTPDAAPPADGGGVAVPLPSAR